ISLPMMARVRPARASERMGWRAAKAVSSAKSILRLSQVGPRPSVLPEVRKAAGHPPSPGIGVVGPALDVARLAGLLGVAVDHADFDLAGCGAVAGAAALLPVRRDLHLLVALELQRR